jgi:hypothetical protein
MKFRLAFLAAAVGASGAAACNDPNENINLLTVVADTLTVYALTGTAPSFPSGYYSATGAVTRVDGTFNFDIAFDINAQNEVVVYPQRLIGVSAVGAKPVGIQRLTVPFEDLGRAPSSGYAFDSSFVVTPGEGLILQVQASAECSIYFSVLRYTKLVVDSIDASRRAVFFHTVHNPNCGYRSLIPGEVPRN